LKVNELIAIDVHTHAEVSCRQEPDEASKVVTTMTRGDEFLATGEEKNSFIKVEGASASGWVKMSMVVKH